MTNEELKKDIIKRMGPLGLRHGHETVFRDWCEIMALSIQNGCDILHGDKWQARENRYLDIINTYTPEQRIEFPKMFGDLCNMLNIDPFQDALGVIYMELFTSQQKTKTLGQCFTPIDVSKVSAMLSAKDINLDIYSISNPLTFNDCAVGGGAMPIAAMWALNERGFDWQRKCRITCNDIDKLCVHMCYVQLSLIGARAIVLHQDTMTQNIFDRFITPMDILWPATLIPTQDDAGHAEIDTETPQIQTEQSEPIQTPAEPKEREIKPSGRSKQLSLF